MSSFLPAAMAVGLCFSCCPTASDRVSAWPGWPSDRSTPARHSASGSPQTATAGSAEPDPARVRLFTEFDLAHVGGYVDVREGPEGGPGSGTRMALEDLGLDTAAIVSLGVLIPAGEDSDFRIRLRYWFLSGSGTFAQDVGFNGIIYAAGQPIEADVFRVDFLADWRPSIWSFAEGGALRLLLGVDFRYVDFQTDGTLAAGSPAADPSEGFYKQELPLPSLGLRVDYALSPDVALHAEAFGFRAIGWDSLRSEGGEVILSQDNFEASVGAAFRLGEAWELEAGLRFGYLFMDEQSPEDGNVLLLRDGGAFVGLRVRL
jgi:hypothetical protein